jgi:leucyl/phenylalanyl-tRNA--protein transferase
LKNQPSVGFDGLLRSRLLRRALSKAGKIVYAKIARPAILKHLEAPERIVSLAFREFSPVSERFVETALCCVFNAVNPTPAGIVNNYCQGAVLFGVFGTGTLEWKLPSQRAIATKESAHLPRRLKDYLRKDMFEIRFDSNFEEVVNRCRRETGTWITDPLVRLYKELFERGFCWSVEAYQQNVVVGGMWGIVVGGVFAVMSIFHSVDQAGSVVMGKMTEKVMSGEIPVLDWGAPRTQFTRFGAVAVSRSQFVETVAYYLNHSSSRPTGGRLNSNQCLTAQSD